MNQVILLTLLLITSCANYVSNIHKQMDRDERIARGENGRPKSAAPQEGYWRNRFHPENDKRPIQNPKTFSLSDGGPSGSMKPPVKRDYRPQRYQADDFKDNDSDGSLWANQGNSASLFTYQNDKHTGDMVIINVLESLRNQISSELKRTFPDRPVKKKPGEEKKEDKAAAASAQPPGREQDHEMDMKVYDKISGTVVEELNKDYIVLKGRKEVIFKKEKRSIEVQALVSRKDIMENDYVNSDRLLESRVFVLGREN
ncbi:MAG: flagellar basal body L-ring protein FlgH [Bacteriovoracaceae bacterium]